jgi:hypothetical protein
MGITSIHDWLLFLKQSGSAIGFPLVVVGVGLMLFGWRVWKVAVVMSYAVIGAGLAAWIKGPCDQLWPYMLGGAIALGALSYKPITLAVSLLGGAVGGFIVMLCFETIGLRGTPLWAAGAAALIACTSVSYLNRQHIIIIVTAFQGAVLVLSGLTAWVMASYWLYDAFQSLTTDSMIVLPFMLAVPTVMSSFYQLAEVHRVGGEV